MAHAVHLLAVTVCNVKTGQLTYELLATQVIPVRSVEACTFHAQRIQTSPEAGKLWP